MNNLMNILVDFSKSPWYKSLPSNDVEEARVKMVPSQPEVEEILGPFHGLLYDIVTGAWEDWLNSSEFAFMESPSTRAAIVWSRMIGRARIAFLDIPNIRMRSHHNTYSFIVDDTVLFRLKKSDEAGFTANYPTQTALDFHDHDNENGCYQLSLFGLEDYLRVEVTYALDNLEVEIYCVRVVARNKSKIAWSYEIQPQAVPVAETPPPPPMPSAARRIVRPRVSKKVSIGQE